jgi:hypothetical protein
MPEMCGLVYRDRELIMNVAAFYSRIRGFNPLATICGHKYGIVSTLNCIFCEKLAWLPFPQKSCSFICPACLRIYCT